MYNPNKQDLQGHLIAIRGNCFDKECIQTYQSPCEEEKNSFNVNFYQSLFVVQRKEATANFSLLDCENMCAHVRPFPL